MIIVYDNQLAGLGVNLMATDSLYPVVRVTDGDVGLMFQGEASSHALRFSMADEGYFNAKLIIPAGHNLDGVTLELYNASPPYAGELCPEGGSLLVTHVVSGTGDIIMDASGSGTCYELSFTDPVTYVRYAECYVGRAYELEREPSAKLSGELEDVVNREVVSTRAGVSKTIRTGRARRHRRYGFTSIGSVQKSHIERAWESGGPFWLQDHSSQWLYARFTSAPDIRAVSASRYRAVMSILEVL